MRWQIGIQPIIHRGCKDARVGRGDVDGVEREDKIWRRFEADRVQRYGEEDARVGKELKCCVSENPVGWICARGPACEMGREEGAKSGCFIVTERVAVNER